MTQETARIILTRMYDIMVEDTGRTLNINMHTFSCFAVSEDEAIGKMYRLRPEFKGREIQKITAEKTPFDNH